MGLGFW